MRRHFMAFLSLIELDDLLGINRESNIRINNDTKKTRIRIDESGEISFFDVVQHGGFVKTSEVGHILLLVKLGRIHLLDIIF
jgi:hypothetical protein